MHDDEFYRSYGKLANLVSIAHLKRMYNIDLVFQKTFSSYTLR